MLSNSEVFLSNVFPPKATLTQGATINMRDLMNFKGDIIGMSIYNSEQTQIKINDRVELKNTYDYSGKKNIVAVSGDLVVTREIGSKTIEILTNYNNLRATINLDTVKIDNKKLDVPFTDCEYINISSTKKDIIILSYVCFRDFVKQILLLKIPRVGAIPKPEDIDVKTVTTISFEIGEYHETMID